MLANLKAGTRLGIAFGLVMMLLVAVVVLSIKNLAAVNQVTHVIVEDRYAKSVQAADIRKTMNLTRIALRDMLLERGAEPMRGQGHKIEEYIATNRADARVAATTLKKAETDMRKDLPSFNADTLIGTNIDTFHRNPSHQRNMLKNLTGTHRAAITVGGRSFRLTANPVFNDRGERLGSSMEWIDATAEVAVEKEVSSIVQSAVAGDLGKRLSLEGKDGCRGCERRLRQILSAAA